MRAAAIDRLMHELGGPGTVARASIWWTPAFHPECGVVLVRDARAWRGWWVTTNRETRGDPVLAWLDPGACRESCPLSAEELGRLAAAVSRLSDAGAPPARAGRILDGCVLTCVATAAGERLMRTGNLGRDGEADARKLTEKVCSDVEHLSRHDRMRAAFVALAAYLR
jgi:hypothetical protein